MIEAEYEEELEGECDFEESSIGGIEAESQVRINILLSIASENLKDPSMEELSFCELEFNAKNSNYSES